MDSGFATVRHGKKKVDQETQSPLLKIFKDVMLKEASDQEKISLLSDRQDEHKRNQYSTQCKTTLLPIPSMKREPTVHTQKKDTRRPKGKKSDKKLDGPFARQFDAFCVGKNKEQEAKGKYCKDPKCSADDTFSCHSCAFKKLICKEYKLPCKGRAPGYVILLVLLALLAYLTSCSCGTTNCYSLESWFKDSNETPEDIRPLETTGPAAGRANEVFKGTKGARNVEVGMVERLKDVVGYREGTGYKDGLDSRGYPDNSVQSDMNMGNYKYGSAPGLSGMSYLNNLDDNLRAPGNRELDQILQRNKDFQHNANLQNFYKRLLATDEQIQKLKKSQTNVYSQESDSQPGYDYYPRYKRSLWRFRRPFRLLHHAKAGVGTRRLDAAEKLNASVARTEFPTTIEKGGKESNRRRRNIAAFSTLHQVRFLRSDDPSKVLIQKKNIMVRVQPDENDRRSKCTHVTSDSKSHETKLKHPFYKNSQRLDELLDQLLDKNLNHILSDPLQKDSSIKHDHSKQEEHAMGSNTGESDVVTPKPSTENALVFGRFFKNPFKLHEKKKKKGGSSIPLLLDEFISNGGSFREDPTTTTAIEQTTTVNDESCDESTTEFSESHKKPSPNRNHAVIIAPSNQVSLLKLRQTSWPHLTVPSQSAGRIQHANKEPRSPSSNLRHLLQVDDAYEISLHYTDGNEVLSDDLEPQDDAEKGETTFGKRSAKEGTSGPMILTNPNWKGPMPLYSDEIRDLVSAPSASKEQNGTSGAKKRTVRSSARIKEYDVRDAQAQAYSDYGVLEDAVFSTNKKTSQKTSPTELTVVSSKYSYKRDNDIVSEGMSMKAIEDHKKSLLHDWQRSKAGLLSEWGDRLGKLIKIMPYEPEDNDSLQEPATVSELQKDKGAKKSKFFRTRSLLGVSGSRRFRREGNDADDDEDDEDDDDDDDDNNERNDANDSPVKIASFKIIRKRAADAPRIELVDKTKNFNESDQFMSMLSQWFGNMAAAANGSDCGRQKRQEKSTEGSEYSQVTHYEYPRSRNPSPWFPQPPAWRQRSLLSLNEDNTDDEKVNEDKVGDEQKVINNTEAIIKESPNTYLNKSLSEESTDEAKRSTELTSNKSITIQEADLHTAGAILNKTETAAASGENNKTVVKRNAPLDEKGLTFWNDLYDDEYGVQVDSLNGPEGTAKSSGNLRDSKRSGNWLTQKYRNLKNMMHDRTDDQDVQGGTVRRIRDTSVGGDTADAQTLHPTLATSDFTDIPKVLMTKTKEQEPVSFQQLTVKMKDVVGQAAKAVKEANTAQIPSLPVLNKEINETEPDVGNSLMQQLMRMMSDVMDYQVHARTCLQPPEDLRVFLFELTAPDPGRRLRDVDGEYQGYRSGEGYSNIGSDDMLSSGPLHQQDTSQSECYDTLKAVQGLMTEYDMLSDEEKKNMMGVGDYLQKQMDFLQSQCPSYGSDYSFDLSPYYQDIMPIKRVKRRALLSNVERQRVGKRRFLKLWSRTTASGEGPLPTDTDREKYKDSMSVYSAEDKLKEAQHAYEMGMKQLSELNFDVRSNNVKPNGQTLDQLRRNLLDAEKSYDKIIQEKTLPKPMEDMDPVFQLAAQDPDFQAAHRDNVDHFNKAKKLYDKSLKDFQAAKEKYDKSTSLYNLHRIEFEKSVKQIELAKQLYKVSADNLKKVYGEFLRPKKRNLYDVYYRAVSEAKKVASTTESRKNGYRRTTFAVKV